MWKYSRRGVVGILLAPLFRRLHLDGQFPASATAKSLLESPTAGAAEAPARTRSRTYRADAVILFLGLSIYRRAAVGGGKASVEETGKEANLQRTLFFAAGADPKRSHGVSRLGWMREIVRGPAATPSEVAYFGVLTSSPEESLEHARKLVAAPPAGRSVFSAVSGRNTPSHSRSAVKHFEFAADAVWSDRRLIDQAQSMFQAGVDWRETSWPNWPNQAPPTFLMQVANLLGQRTRRAVGRYVYSEQEYLLELEAQQTSRGRERLLPVRGKIRNLRTGRETPFRLWMEDGAESILPFRIEFQPRSFLKLTFEAVPG